MAIEIVDHTKDKRLPKCRVGSEQGELFELPWPSTLDVVILSNASGRLPPGLSLKPSVVVARHDEAGAIPGLAVIPLDGNGEPTQEHAIRIPWVSVVALEDSGEAYASLPPEDQERLREIWADWISSGSRVARRERELDAWREELLAATAELTDAEAVVDVRKADLKSAKEVMDLYQRRVNMLAGDADGLIEWPHGNE